MRSLIGALLVTACLPGGAGAQDAATLLGSVRDQYGTLVAGVEVTVLPEGPETGRSPARAVTDGSGRFRVTVPPGVPSVVVFRRDGYVEEEIRLEPLRPGATRSLPVTLRPLYRLDAVSVVAARERPLINTLDATTGGALEPREIEGLPTDARDPLALAFTVPGVSQATGFFGDAPPLTIAGANSLYTQYVVDGLDNNEGFLGGPRVEFPLAGIRRLRVHATSYSAAYGRSSNGVVELETAAGGDSWNGELFGFWRPGIPIDAEPKFAPPGTEPEGFRRVQVGGALGGPLIPGRSFFFGTVEYSDEREDRIGSTARAEFIGTEIRETWKAFGRLDHGWAPEQTTTVQFAFSDVSREGRGGGVVTPEADITTRRIGSLTALAHRTSLGGGRAGNAISVQVGTFRWFFPPSESDLETPQVIIVAPDSVTVEAVVGSSNFVFDESELQLQLRETFEARLGAHTLRAGADWVRSSFELDGANTNPQGAYTVINDGNITPSGRFLSISDIPDDVRVLRYTIDANPQEVDLAQTTVGAYVEDTWRVLPSLTLRLGLRWDYDDITSRGESSPDLDNFQPRLSANWHVAPASVVRGGFGLFTGKFPYAVFSDAVQFGPDGNASVTFQGGEFPPPAFGEGPTAAELDALRDRLPPREIRRTFALGLEQPFSYQGTIGFQRQLGDAWGVSVDGVWVETRNLPRSWDLNAITRDLTPADTVNRPVEFGDRFRPVEPAPGSFRRLTTTESGGRARHIGLYATVRRQFSESVGGEASWVWSRTRTDAEDINFQAAQGNDFAAEWADAINDRRHHLTARASYTWSDRLRLTGIGDFQTGSPINRVAFFRDLDGSGPIFGEAFVGNFDRFPGVPRNAERLPSEFQLALGAAWLVPIGGGRLEVRADVFNALNSTISSGFANGIPGGGPRTQVGRPGHPIAFSTAGPPRQFQFSGRWVF